MSNCRKSDRRRFRVAAPVANWRTDVLSLRRVISRRTDDKPGRVLVEKQLVIGDQAWAGLRQGEAEIGRHLGVRDLTRRGVFIRNRMAGRRRACDSRVDAKARRGDSRVKDPQPRRRDTFTIIEAPATPLSYSDLARCRCNGHGRDCQDGVCFDAASCLNSQQFLLCLY